MAEQRAQWSSRIGFILAAAGSAVGLGNLWKFPYITYENRGGAFVLVYLGAIALVGTPIMVAEILLGRRSQQNPVGAFRVLARGRPGGKAWQGVGFLGVTTGFIILSYYSVVAGWTLRYILMAISGTAGATGSPPGGSADLLQRVSVQLGPADPVRERLHGAHHRGRLPRGRGGHRACRSHSDAHAVHHPRRPGGVLLLDPWASAGHACSCSGPTSTQLTSGGVLEALGHSFFTLSLGMGAMLTYGSYMGRKESIPHAAVTIALLDTVIAIMACVVMFSIIFSFDFDVTRSSTILFTTLPVVFFKLPGGAVISALFYLLVAFAALTSTISLLEVVASYAIDELGWARRRAALTAGAAIFVFGVLSAVSLGGSPALSRFNLIGRSSTAGVFGTFDYLASNWLLPVGGLLIALFVGWALSAATTRDELETGHGRMTLFAVWRFVIRFVAPAAVAAIIVSVILGAEYQ